MFFTYIYEDDPQKEQLQGNIIWTIPNFSMPSHWVHTEDICMVSIFKFILFLIFLYFFFYISGRPQTREFTTRTS